MSSRKCLYFFLVCAVSGAIAAFVMDWFRERTSRPEIETWRLENPVAYSKEVQEGVAAIQTEQQACVLWKKKKGVLVENPEFQRQVTVHAYEMAGNSAVLFPGTGGLTVSETGCCILSNDVAWKLFGSSDIIGKKVKIGERELTVSGITFQKEEMCAYELRPEEGHKLTHAAVQAGSGAKNHILKQEVGTFLN